MDVIPLRTAPSPDCGGRPGWEQEARNSVDACSPPSRPSPAARGREHDYAELHCLSDFSFGRGASSAGELFERAQRQDYRALAITDECSLAGIVRGLEASRATGLRMIVGSEVTVDAEGDTPLKLVLLVENREGYSSLCRLITQGRRRSSKGEYRLVREDLADLPGLLALWIPDARMASDDGAWLRQRFDSRLWLAVELHRGADDARRLQDLLSLADSLGIPAVASGDVHMHVRGRRALQDTMTAIRHRTTIAQAGKRLFPNGERHLRTRRALSAIYPQHLLAETLRVAERCRFSLETDLGYQYPHELVPAGHTPETWLRKLVEDGVRERWPEGESTEARELIEKELGLIRRKDYEPYFLTVHDIVRFARSRKILCQGRGSAANSVVCYTLGVTSIDPARMGLLFERFLSDERNEPPDIDIDFEHERREEVIQYLYERYGRDRAAIAATVIRYRTRSAARDVGRVLGLPEDQLAQLSRSTSAWSTDTPSTDRLREYGFDPDSPLIRRLVDLVGQLLGKPRHLSQHVGGFVISEHPLHTLVPVENAAMDERTIIQWDKDDLDTMRLLKVDVLALGMLTCVRKALDLVLKHRGRHYTMATIPSEDEATYRMIQRGEVIGVFQIESRAQMAMLPRLKPETFYDLVIEVAIVRPGPIQGGMVHPYLRRRQGKEPVDYPSDALRNVLQRTLGVPLFQEQVMRIAMEAAGYTPGQADQLRRDMAAWKRHGGLEKHREALLAGMARNRYTAEFAERIFEQIKGFGDYGFPESHAASFALITYVSSWIKCHEQAAFSCALLNSLPMGFYQPPQLVADARRHGIEVRPVDVRYSDWDCTLEEGSFKPASETSPLHVRETAPSPACGGGPGWGRESRDAFDHSQDTHPHPSPSPHAGEGAESGTKDKPLALRLGMRLVNGLQQKVADRISMARAQAAFVDLDDLVARADLDRGSLDRLAEAGALRGLAGHRHRARWQSAATEKQLPLFAAANAIDPRAASEPRIAIPPPNAFEDTRADYASVGLTLGAHPVGLIRRQLRQRRYERAVDLARWPDKRSARYAGLVILRQRPQTASGVTFMTLEDETGMVNVVVWAQVAERQRRVFLESQLLAVEGRMESAEGSQHLIATRLEDLSPLLGGVATSSRDFR
ncbi:MAG: error-prone DNA polymerase [Luteimonas sp.]